MRRLSRYDKTLLVIFLFSLPLSNPWVRGDGVGYYAFGRSLLIEHNLNFQKDWLAANTAFRMSRTDASGSILAEQFTSTGHLDNHFSIGPAILWSPFLIAAQVIVRLYDALGGHVAADGYSRPYLLGMALRHSSLRFPVFVDFVPTRAKISRGTMGFSRDFGHLVR